MGKMKVDISDLTMLQVMASAFSAATIAEVTTLPLDTIKVVMQLASKGEYKSGLDCGLRIVKAEGVQGLFKGLQGGVMRQLFYGTTRLAIFDYMNGNLRKTKGAENITIFDRIGLGIFSGATAMTLANPTDVIKVRMQGDPSRYRNFVDAFIKIAKHEGFKGFYQSLAPNVLRNSVINAAELASYDQIKVSFIRNGWMEDNILLHLTASSMAGFIATSVASPFDVLKTRVMNGKVLPSGEKIAYSGMKEAAKSIWTDGGFKGFYKGFNANCQRVISWNIVMFIAKEQFMLYFYHKNQK